MENDVILRIARVCEITGLGRTTIYGRIKEGDFPRGIKLGDRAIGWRLSEVQQWIARQAARRDQRAPE